MFWNAELIEKYNLAGPRYTSYPTAPQFNAKISKITLIEKMLEPSARPLSLYFHIPFCAHLCYYCACNKIITKQYQKGTEYVELLCEEIRLRSLVMHTRQTVSQLHFGGGTPTFLSIESFKTLFECIHQYFDLLTDDSGDYSIEIDPREIDLEKLTYLRQLGFNRLSLGIQDFDATVQQAIHRIQTPELVSEVLQQARALGFHSINFDLIYGLPHQTLKSFDKTLEQVIAMNPDRLSVFNYAHLPERFTPQKRILEKDLPSAATKLALLKHTIERLTDAGYVYIGMDHFARPNDSLAIAQQEQQLQRNFQGYTTHADCDLIAFGTSAIGQFDGTYVQNHVELERYRNSIEHGQLAIMKGYISTQDDKIRQTIIMTLICHFELDTKQIENTFDLVFSDYFSHEMKQLAELEKDGILTFSDHKIQVTPSGKLLIRCVCMIFDAYLTNNITYSKVI